MYDRILELVTESSAARRAATRAALASGARPSPEIQTGRIPKPGMPLAQQKKQQDLKARLLAKYGKPKTKPKQPAPGPAADSDAIPGNPLAQKQQASNIVRALQGGGTTLTKAVLGKITPFMRSGLKTSKVGPVL